MSKIIKNSCTERECEFWDGEKCTDVDWVNEDNDLCCRYQSGARMLQSQVPTIPISEVIEELEKIEVKFNNFPRYDILGAFRKLKTKLQAKLKEGKDE